MKKLNIFEYAEQHKDCPEHTNEYEINGKKYIVHSHFIGKKDTEHMNDALKEFLKEHTGDEEE